MIKNQEFINKDTRIDFGDRVETRSAFIRKLMSHQRSDKREVNERADKSNFIEEALNFFQKSKCNFKSVAVCYDLCGSREILALRDICDEA